ncbi:flagellar biosynthetic protein FliR [Catenovulum sediminis]|uniref:flagellar biosynthetic protein FliR n=1 Tax=Catenovulum sediminis TaxID=1740262 RepID=UPI00117EF471|nr:flagellar biosynthetic protein FliR [Catenovulum sediminis]
MLTLCISFRLLPIFVILPVFSFAQVPMMVRTIFVVAIALCLATGYRADTEQPEVDLVWALVNEFAIGAVLALGFHFAYAAVHFMGHLIDVQIGFAAGSLFDPNTNSVATPVAQLFSLMLAAVFFLLNVHLELIESLHLLFEYVPLFQPFVLSEQWYKILGLFFVTSFVFASPVIIGLWLIDLSLAFVSRSLPQAQIYFVGLPVKIAMGVLLLIGLSRPAVDALHNMLRSVIPQWTNLLSV